jgi:hypothetical protein
MHPALARLSKSVQTCVLVAAVVGVGMPLPPFPAPTAHAASPTYEVKFRVKGIVTTTTVQATNAGQAKKLVLAQYGSSATVLAVRRVN